jgi:hypothetical protein
MPEPCGPFQMGYLVSVFADEDLAEYGLLGAQR